MTFRRLWVLVSQLPPESALAAAECDGWERARYSSTDEVLAQLHELTQENNRLLHKAHFKGGDDVKPQSAPRPFDDE